MDPSADQQYTVQQAARALAAGGLVHAYGHCSLRLDSERFLVSAARPLGLVGSTLGSIVPVTGPLPEGVLGEVRLHQAIYRLSRDVGGICRITPPVLMSLSTQSVVPRARHGFGAYFHPAPAFWNDPRLVRDESTAEKVAAELGAANAIVMRGNGALIVADTLIKAVVLSWFLEDAARVERDVRAMGFAGDSGLMAPEEVSARNVFSGGVIDRMWDWLTREQT